MEIAHTNYVNNIFAIAQKEASKRRHQFITPEHFLYAMLSQEPFLFALGLMGGNDADLKAQLEVFFKEEMESVPEGIDYEIEVSAQLNKMMEQAFQIVNYSESDMLDIPHIVEAMFTLKDSWAAQILKSQIRSIPVEFIEELINEYEVAEELNDDMAGEVEGESQPHSWRSFVTCLNEKINGHNPLIGREEELERTIEVLCRKEKNNPLHVGEPGVGKTALAYGLAALIEKGDVPDRLKGYRIYEMDLAAMVAGSQFRGDFEKRLKSVMEGVQKEGKAIIYIDEIHNLVGAGRSSDSSLDASNILKPYLEGGEIRFIGSTTFDEYNRYFARSKGMIRRFQQIDILEPSEEEAVKIIEGLKPKYEEFHKVKYEPGVIKYAVNASIRHITDRYLPDKAIDLIDEAGAYREIHPQEKDEQTVDKQLITEVLARICKVDNLAMKEKDNEELETLYSRIGAKIYGQDEAVRQVTEAIQMAKAGLLDENKPLASLLFVGPTGVGKTEVAKVLAQELGISLQRFDMSEYTEKHTVAKLIGSPAGYVGYEDGGLLTDAIRKTPYCVLLLDEIEKAHPDIFNILLQVMDYAMLTDNKGRKADCRHLILIMTSNAGAQYAHQASVGFGSRVSTGEAMLKQVKKTFKPEFINRLSATVVFNDMDKQMASLILDKKLDELKLKLATKGIRMEIDQQAHDLLLRKGFVPEYGAREMDRIISSMLKPELMRQILFGSLKKGGLAIVTEENGKLVITAAENTEK